MRNYKGLLGLFLAAVSLVCADSSNGLDDATGEVFKAKLSGMASVPANFTPGTGELKIAVDEARGMVTAKLEFLNLTSAPMAVQIHLGGASENGPAVLTLCGMNSGRLCPSREAVFTFGVAGALVPQGAPYFFDGSASTLMRGLRAGAMYVKINTQALPNGEIRGQVRNDDNAVDDRGRGNEPGDDRGRGNEPGEDRGRGNEPGDDRGRGNQPGDDRGGNSGSGNSGGGQDDNKSGGDDKGGNRK